MVDKPEKQKENVKICLLGASFDTGNMGVSALAESSIKVILNKWPDAEIVLLGSGYTPQEHCLSVLGRQVRIDTLPIRFSKNIFLPYHFLKFVLYALLMKISPGLRLKHFLTNHNRYFRILFETDLVADITGGDSFSDIYGFRRFFLGFLRKWLVIFLGKKLILLPQTYGPFKGHSTKIMAKYVLNHATLVYSRDQAGIEYLQSVLNIDVNSGKVKFAPDLAFILDSRKPDNFDCTMLSKAKDENTILVGLNISGLLFNGGYTKDNMFGLKTDYPSLVKKITDLFLDKEKVVIILVPHVFPPRGLEVESDPDACRKTYELTKDAYKERVMLTNGKYNHNEIKYIIGLCDFFIGSRMHACIAAISQNIPTVGLAYSKKFEGVFESIGLGDCLADARNCGEKQVLEKIESVFRRRNQIRGQLEHVIPQVKENILGILNNNSI
jgi:polysaccharide pyruvyl transferase WcaK-like protein